MLRCPDCRPLILDHLFGLLEAPESVAVESHLATCPACAAERDEVARMQGLLAKAAKGSFPGVRFEAPGTRPAAVVNSTKPAAKPVHSGNAETVAYPTAEAPLAQPAPQDRRSHKNNGKHSGAQKFFSWAVAASILFMLGGAVLLVDSTLAQAESARKNASDSTEKALAALRDFENTDRETRVQRAAAHANLVAAKQAHDGLLAKWVEEEKLAAQNQTARKLSWEVLKPAAVQPGAPNEFLLVVRDRGNTPSGRIVAEFRDQTDAVIYTQPINHEREAQHPIRLPASAWGKLKPESELFLVVSRVDEKTSEKTILQDKVKLLGPVFATVLTTDKAEYHPGETVRFRSLTLDRVTFTPPTRDQFLHYELRGPNGAIVRSGSIQGGTDLVRVVEGNVTPIHGPDGKPIRGVGTGEFLLPSNASEGNYTLIMREFPHPSGSPPVVPFPVTRTLKVRTGIPEAYHKEVGYTAASYSANDTVEAWAELKFKDAPVVGAEVTAVAVADEQVLQINDIQPPVTGTNGRVNFRFTLPPKIQNGDVRVKVTFRAKNENDKAIEETVADRVPVIGQNIVVEFFPEGGDLVAGVPCKVYVRATTPTGHPVDITGQLTDGRRTIGPKIETMTAGNERGVNRGIGSFTYTPELGVPVWLKLNTPTAAFSPLLTVDNGKFPTGGAALAGIPAVAGTRTGFLLPKVKLEGVVMTVPNPVTKPGEPIRVHLRSVGRERNLVVGAYTRGRLSDTKTVTVKASMPAEVQLMGSADPRGGVVRVTVFEKPDEVSGEPEGDLIPVAERLIFRRPGEALNLALATTGPRADTRGFLPGSQVSLNITATNEKGTPTAAILYAAAVNTAVAPGAKDRLLTTHFLLAGEVNNPDAMEYADFLLTDHAEAAKALDLVLGTQGWRRFAEQVPKNYAKAPTAPTLERANLLVCNGQYMTAAEPTSMHEQQKLRDTYWPRYETAVKNLDAAKAAAEAAEADKTAIERAKKLAAVANAACEEAKAEAAQAKEALAPVERFRGAGWFAVGGFGLLAALLAVASFSSVSSRLPLGIGSVGSVALAAFLVIAIGMAEQTQAAAEAANEVVKLPAGRVSATVPVAPSNAPKAGDAPVAEQNALGAVPKNNALSEKPGTAKDGQGKTNGVEAGAFPGLGGLDAAGGGVGAGPGAPAAPVFGMPPGLGGPQGVNVNPGRRYEGNKEDKVYPPLPPRGGPVAGGGSPPTAAAPAAPGGAPVKLAGDGGWQPGVARKTVPDELLAKFRELRRLENGRDTSNAGKGAAGNTPMDAKATVDARSAADKHEKRDADQYWLQVEKAKKQAEAKADQLRRHIDATLEQQKALRDEGPTPSEGGTRLQNKVLAESLAVNRLRQAIPTVTPLVVREYAAPRPGTSEKESLAFLTDDTILWQPVIVLPSDGKITLNMHVGAAEGGYQVIVAGHTLDGRLGASRALIPISNPTQSEANPVPVPGTAPPGKP